MKNNNKLRWKRTATGVSTALYLMCNSAVAQDEASDNTFTLNLKNTDIHSLIATVSKQTGKNFVVDPRVKAKVTVISTDPVGADGLYEVFLSVLQVHGYSAVPAGDLIKIVPDVTAKQGPVPILGDNADSSDQLVTQVIKVIHVPAAQLVPILRPMVPQQGHLAAYAATNSLIITDRSSNIQRLSTIIKRIDVPDNEEIEVVRLNHAAASEIVGTLTSLQRNNIGGAQGPGAVQLVADERTNSILISGDRAARVRTRGLIAHLDTPIESGGNTRVVYLKYANAEDMVSILQGVSQGQAKVGATTDSSSTNVPAAPVVQAAPQQNAPQNPNVAATQAAIQAQNNAIRARSAVDSGTSNVDIQADSNTNSLIITAPADEMQNILAVIRQLDIRRAQVLVEAVIAEITEDNTREFGINFLIDGSEKDVPVGYSNLGGGTEGALGIAGALANDTAPSSLGAGISLALGRFGSGEIDFGFLVRAIASDADNNILSTPSLMTLDNEEAEIVVGSNVPFVTGQQLSSNNNNPFQTIERRDIGLTLKVKPQINEGNTIKMVLEQEVSNVNTTAVTGASDIVTSKRSIKTTVLVEDGQTLVLGGLIDDQIADVEEKVPLLGDIPLIGNLFRYRNTRKTKQNLLIFLHPVIMRDSETASQYSNSKYNFLRSQQTLYRQEKDRSIQKDKPYLPELKLFFEGEEIDSPLTRFDDPDNSDNVLDILARGESAPVPAVPLVSTAGSDAQSAAAEPQLPALHSAQRMVDLMDRPVDEDVLDLTQDEITGKLPETAVTADVIPLQTFPPEPVAAHSPEPGAQASPETSLAETEQPNADLTEGAITARDGTPVVLGKQRPRTRTNGIEASISSDHDQKLVEISAVAAASGTTVKKPLFVDNDVYQSHPYLPLETVSQPDELPPSPLPETNTTATPATRNNAEAPSPEAEVSILSITVIKEDGTESAITDPM